MAKELQGKTLVGNDNGYMATPSPLGTISNRDWLPMVIDWDTRVYRT